MILFRNTDIIDACIVNTVIVVKKQNKISTYNKPLMVSLTYVTVKKSSRARKQDGSQRERNCYKWFAE